MISIKCNKEQHLNLSNQIKKKSGSYFKDNYLDEYDLSYDALLLIKRAFEKGAELVLSQLIPK